MEARDEAERAQEEELKPSWSELFYDLVLAVGIAGCCDELRQCALSGKLDHDTMLTFGLQIGSLWWLWHKTVLFINTQVAHAENLPALLYDTLVALQMVPVAGMAVEVRGSDDDRFERTQRFLMFYLGGRFIMLCNNIFFAIGEPQHASAQSEHMREMLEGLVTDEQDVSANRRRLARRARPLRAQGRAALILVEEAMWVAAALVRTERWQKIWWASGMAFKLLLRLFQVIKLLRISRSGVHFHRRFDSAHMAEREGLLIIIVLGEVIKSSCALRFACARDART